MSVSRFCPRCGGLMAAHAEGGAWRCERHGQVVPVEGAKAPDSAGIHALARDSTLPVWLPWPLPLDWVVAGAVRAADGATGQQATAVACSGPAPLGGLADLVIVAERPGVGLGAGFAALAHADPDGGLWSGPAAAKVSAAGHPTALWSINGPTDRAVFVGEAVGAWLWMVLWPADAGHLLADGITLMDLREDGEQFDVPCGALSPRLPHA